MRNPILLTLYHSRLESPGTGDPFGLVRMETQITLLHFIRHVQSTKYLIHKSRLGIILLTMEGT